MFSIKKLFSTIPFLGRRETASEVFKRRLGDLNPWQRRETAKRTKDAGILMCLVEDEDEYVRLHVAMNPSVPDEGLVCLERDEQAAIQNVARAALFTRSHAIAEMLGMCDDVELVESMLTEHPSQVLSMLGWESAKLPEHPFLVPTPRPLPPMIGFREARQ